MKYSAKKIVAGQYEYRGFKIQTAESRYAEYDLEFRRGDWLLWNQADQLVTWTYSLRDAKFFIDEYIESGVARGSLLGLVAPQS